MTSPKHAEATANGRFYTHPVTGEQLISVTNAISVGCAKPALVPWAAKIAAEYAIEHQGELMALSRTDKDAATKAIKSQVTVARDKAADLGSAVHHAAERKALGLEPLFVGEHEQYAEQGAPFVEQLLRFWDDFGVDVQAHIEATEMTVAHPSYGYAGTLDTLTWLPIIQSPIDGKVKRCDGDERALWLVDYKTSATRAATSVYGEYALQVTALKTAREMWLPDDTVSPFNLTIGGCAVLNLRRRTYELVPLPSGNPEREAFHSCLGLAKWMHSTGKAITGGEFRPVTPKGTAKPKRTRKAAANKEAA